MLSSRQLFFILSITLIVLAVHCVNGVPLNSDGSNEINSSMDDESRLSKRRLPVEGILIGRRAFPSEGILLGKRDYPTEGILLGKRNYPTGGILLGKRGYPTEGILLGKRNSRFPAPKSMAHNQVED